MKKILVIGGGAAGLIAAGTAARRGCSVVLAERNDRPARKVMITGKGRCNLTNATFDVKDLIANVPVNGRFLYSSFSAFGPADIMSLVESRGVPLKTERGARVFPQSDRAVDVVDALVRYAVGAGVKIVKARVTELRLSGGRICGALTADGRLLQADAYILATGGCSYPLTGSTGDGYALARQAGHTVVPPRPALVPLELEGGDHLRLQGLSLKNVTVKLIDPRGKTAFSGLGEMLFTHFGASGPLILSATVAIDDLDEKRYTLAVDLKPALSEEKLDARLLRELEDDRLSALSNVLRSMLPRSMIPVILDRAGATGEEKASAVGRALRLSLVRAMKDLTFPVKGTRGFDEAIVTAGGVDVKQIDPKTMRSKLCEDLYFAGELIDVAAYTGGFNLQIAFSTGAAAGNGV